MFLIVVFLIKKACIYNLSVFVIVTLELFGASGKWVGLNRGYDTVDVDNWSLCTITGHFAQSPKVQEVVHSDQIPFKITLVLINVKNDVHIAHIAWLMSPYFRFSHADRLIFGNVGNKLL